jgi:acyl-coenzyme A thioesterase PaaI-like protein
MSEHNRLRRTLARIDRLPQALRGWVRQKAIHFNIPFTGTAKLVVDELEPDIVRVRINNRRATRNHIKGVHAAAIALAAETASGLAVGMHLPDDKLPLLKTMAFRYTRRCAGGITAEARVTSKQIREMEELDKGEAKVEVQLWDDENEKPVECVLVWAWVKKKTKG